MSAHAADLASHGYVVVGIDVPGETRPSTSATARSRRRCPARERVRRDDRAALARHALRALAARLAARRRPARPPARRRVRPLQRRRDRRDAMLVDRRVRAGLNLDGAIFGPASSAASTARSASLHGAGPDAAYASMFEMRSHLRGPRPLRVLRPRAAQQLRRLRLAGPATRPRPGGVEVGTIDPAAAVSRQTMLLRRFFDRYVAA